MALEICTDEATAARQAAHRIAMEAQAAFERRGRFGLAVSGGSTPGRMFRALARETLPWRAVHLFQVDERLAPTGHPDRNLEALRTALAEAPLPPDRIHPMPVEDPAPERAASLYADRLERILGTPPILDLVHLGLGADGHTASLFPGDPVLEIVDRSVGITHGTHQGRRRMTLTIPTLARARRQLWLVTGASKASMLTRLLAGDPAIPAGHLYDAARSFVVVDRAAAAEVPG